MKKNILRTIILLLTLCFAHQAYAQVVAPTGTISRSSSQLIYFYDQSTIVESSTETTSYIQVTNTSLSEEVWIHVQVFRNFDPDGFPGNGDGDEVICDERNFVDMLTPRDTHVYDLSQMNFPKNMGETESDPGESTSIDVTGTKGFIVITPVVSQSDLSGIAFQHLIGATNDDLLNFRLSAMGRDAIDFTTGEIAPDGTVMDGVTNGYLLLQPEELVFSFPASSGAGDFIGIAFQDVYSDPGLLGYQIVPGAVDWTTFIFDYKESPTSCGEKTVNCFLTSGLNGDVPQNNLAIAPSLLCGGTGTPTNTELGIAYGWTRIFVSGVETFENHVGVMYINSSLRGADWMFVRGERTEITPPVDEDCTMEGDEDGDGFADCMDTDCATAEVCETGFDECTDGIDNDEDGMADCADLGCDGTIVDSESGVTCEFGSEISCDDGFDNDGDGDVDAMDDDCTSDTGGSLSSGSGGCNLNGSMNMPNAVLNLLLPLFLLLGFTLLRSRGLRRNYSKVHLSKR